MAKILGCTANNTFTTAATWGVCDATAALDSESGQTALTVATQDSAVFVLAAVAVDGVYLKLQARAAGSPSNTLTVVLRNSTTATNALTKTVNVSDLVTCDGTNKEGGWFFINFGATVTPNGTDSYLIRVNISATTTAVTLWTNGTAANWARQVRTTTTSAPGAGDRMIIARELTGTGTGNNRAVTMDNTAATTFGNATGISTTRNANVNAVLNICNGGTLTWGTTGGIAYFLSLTGSIVVYSGGTYTCGSSGGNEIPRNSSAIVEFVMTTSMDSRFEILPGATVEIRGLSRTAGKDIYYTTLSANAAAAATTLNVNDDTGWLATDTIAIASTTRTTGESEERILNANAGATSMVTTVGLTNAHGGANDVVAEVALITRNVEFRSNNSARFSMMDIVGQASGAGGTTSVILRWCGFRYFGSSNTAILLVSSGGYGTSSVFDMQYCTLRDYGTAGQPGVNFSSTSGGTTITADNNVLVGIGSGAGTALQIAATTNTTWTARNNVIIAPLGGTMAISDAQGVAASGNRCIGSTAFSIVESGVEMTPGLIDNTVVHSCAGSPTLTVYILNQTVQGFKAWRNNGQVSLVSGFIAANAVFKNGLFFGNLTTNVTMQGPLGAPLIFDTCTFAGDTTFSTATGFSHQAAAQGMSEVIFRNCSFGVASGTKTTHSTTDVAFAGTTNNVVRMFFVNTTMSSATKLTQAGASIIPGNMYSRQQIDGTVAHDRKFWGIGTVAYETGTVHTSGFSEKLTPTITGNFSTGAVLRSSIKRVAVNSGDTVTPNVFVLKDGSYNGAVQPRLVLLANPAIGILVDTVLYTMTVGSATWEAFTFATAAATAAGVMEFVVEVTGTAGNAYVAEWTMS
jgi:hypothetical protein